MSSSAKKKTTQNLSNLCANNYLIKHKKKNEEKYRKLK